MDISYATTSYLSKNFQQFYHEVLRQKELALRASGVADSEEVAQNLCQKIQHRFRILLEEQSVAAAQQIGEFAYLFYQEAQYIMVSLADEIFLSIKWPGRKQWEKNLLEAQLFQTQIAGELFFKKLDSLLEANDPIKAQLAVVYLCALGLGFRGKYKGKEDSGRIQQYRLLLFRMVNRRPSDLFKPGRAHLIDKCYHHTLGASFSRGLPDLRLWLYAFGGIFTFYLLTTFVLWYKLVRDMDSTISVIIEQTKMIS